MGDVTVVIMVIGYMLAGILGNACYANYAKWLTAKDELENSEQEKLPLRRALEDERDRNRSLQLRLTNEEWRHKRLREKLEELAGDSEPLQS